MSKTIILIPSRYSARRLPGKPLLKIKNLPIISHVVRKAKLAKVGKVYVATDSLKIMKEVQKDRGKAIITKKKHKTGTDRIFEAFKKLNDKKISYIINLQGDEPGINFKDIQRLNKFMRKNKSQIGTIATQVYDKKIFLKKSAVKVETYYKLNSNNFPLAKKFVRSVKSAKSKNYYHHMGIYAFRVDTFKKFVSLRRTINEKKYSLEQLRAIDNKIPINVCKCKTFSFGIDTIKDYLKMKKIIENKY